MVRKFSPNVSNISHFNDSAWVRGSNLRGTVLILSYFQMWKVNFSLKDHEFSDALIKFLNIWIDFSYPSPG